VLVILSGETSFNKENTGSSVLPSPIQRIKSTSSCGWHKSLRIARTAIDLSTEDGRTSKVLLPSTIYYGK
jgi:hypothetical protein